MGFGTLFIGYFLILNVTYYSFTDVISALVMMLALYKLSGVNVYFKYGMIASGVFAALGVTELILQVLSMFGGIAASYFFLTSAREFIICVLTSLILLGIKDVAYEVGLPKVAKRAERMLPVTFTVYPLTIILNAPALFDKVAPIAVAAIFTLVLVATIFLAIYNLITLYSCYMRICMPKDLEFKEKSSKIGIVNKFREHEKEKALEYQIYKTEKTKQKGKKK